MFYVLYKAHQEHPAQHIDAREHLSTASATTTELPGKSPPLPGVWPHSIASTHIVASMGAPASDHNPGNNGPNGFGFAPGDDGPQTETATGTTSRTPTAVETKAKMTIPR
jgi:hypothetical protein